MPCGHAPPRGWGPLRAALRLMALRCGVLSRRDPPSHPASKRASFRLRACGPTPAEPETLVMGPGDDPGTPGNMVASHARGRRFQPALDSALQSAPRESEW